MKKQERLRGWLSTFVFFTQCTFFNLLVLTSAAPAKALYFFYLMRKFKSIDLESAEETIKSFERHLGYLSEELVVFSIFDDSVSYAEKTMKGQKLMNLPRPKVFTPNKTEDSDYYLARRRKSFFIVFY